MQLFYNSNIDETVTEFSFDKEESRHIIKVLRKNDGDTLHVTNGKGFLFVTEVVLASDTKCNVKIISFEKKPEPKFKLHLAVSPTKMNDRYEMFLEKATEIGIQEITPIICDHSERKMINTDRYEKIILSALKQSNEFYLPQLNPSVTFKEFIKQNKNEGLHLIAHCEEKGEAIAKKTLKSVLQINKDVTLLIGPEGDFSEKEIELALQNKYQSVSLGSTRLRTETAAIVACHSVAFFNES